MPIPATQFIWFNGKLVPWEKATVHVMSHALHYASSVFEGVRAYIREHRQKDFIDNLSRKLLAFSLGRSLQLSDEPLIERMQAKLMAKGYRFTPMVDLIVTSPQFLNKRRLDSQGQKGE